MFYMLGFVCCLVGKSIWLLKKNRKKKKEGVERGKEKGRERGGKGGEGKKEPTGETEKASSLNPQTELGLEAGFTSSCISPSE